jgi:hypothetical protein
MTKFGNLNFFGLCNPDTKAFSLFVELIRIFSFGFSVAEHASYFFQASLHLKLKLENYFNSFFVTFIYRVFHRFGQAKFAHSGSILSLSQFLQLPQLP